MVPSGKGVRHGEETAVLLKDKGTNNVMASSLGDGRVATSSENGFARGLVLNQAHESTLWRNGDSQVGLDSSEWGDRRLSCFFGLEALPYGFYP